MTIAPYQALTSVITMSGEVYNIALPIAEVVKIVSSPHSKFLSINPTTAIAIHQIVSIKEYNPTDIEFFILSLPQDIKSKVQKRTEDMKALGKKWESVAQIHQWLDYKGIKYKV